MEPGTAAIARESLQPQMILFVPMLIAEAMTMPVIVPHCTRVFRRPLHLHDRHADLNPFNSHNSQGHSAIVFVQRQTATHQTRTIDERRSCQSTYRGGAISLV